MVDKVGHLSMKIRDFSNHNKGSLRDFLIRKRIQGDIETYNAEGTEADYDRQLSLVSSLQLISPNGIPSEHSGVPFDGINCNNFVKVPENLIFDIMT